MGIILWILFGGLVGWLASMMMRSEQGVLMDIIVGIIGAILGGWIMSLLGLGGVSGFNLYSFVVAIIGSMILIAIVRAFRHRQV